MGIRAGELRLRASIQELVETPAAGFNQPAEDYQAVASRRVGLRPISGRELEAAGATRSERTHVIRMRPYEGLTPKHRLVIDGAAYNVVAVLQPDDGYEVHVLEDLSVAVEAGYYLMENGTDFYEVEASADLYALED